MTESRSTLPRRAMLGGAATVGAVAAVGALVPRAPSAPAAASVAKPVLPAEELAGGYRLSDHVKRYYETARV